MPELLISVSKGFVDAGMISAPSNLRGMKLGLREFVNVADLGIFYLNSPLSTRRSYIKTLRDVVLRVLRAYYQAVQETRNDRNSALKILAKYVRVDDTEILSEVYRIYGTNHLQKNLNIDLEGVKGLLKGLGSEATQVDPTAFIDISLLQDLDRQGFFQAKNR
jgi:ABC-type nitrate/sulfonate/bicarbonate transport system substrate-binding protein